LYNTTIADCVKAYIDTAKAAFGELYGKTKKKTKSRQQEKKTALEGSP